MGPAEERNMGHLQKQTRLQSLDEPRPNVALVAPVPQRSAERRSTTESSQLQLKEQTWGDVRHQVLPPYMGPLWQAHYPRLARFQLAQGQAPQAQPLPTVHLVRATVEARRRPAR